MFNCSLCREQCEEYVYVSSHCSECCEIRRIISLYNRKDVLDTLRLVYLRDEQEKRTNRTVRKVEEEDQAKQQKEILTRSKTKDK